MKSKQNGFTLLEVMLALAIFAMLSILAFMVMSQANTTHQRAQEETRRFNQLQRAMTLFGNDLLQLVARRNRSTDRILLTGNEAIFSTQTRDPRHPLSDTLLLQTVHWYLRDHTLYRALRRSVDSDTDLPAQPVLDHVDQFSLEADASASGELPARVTLHIQHQTYGALDRPFALPGLITIEETKSSAADATDRKSQR